MAQFIIGIDLGTTNSALAYVEDGSLQSFPIAQLVNPNEVTGQGLLPSSLYIPGANEFVEGALALPWNPAPAYITGQLARTRGVENAGRLVSSAKSWLSHQTADPTQPLLPLTAPEGIERISPLEASRQYLEHLRQAWDTAHPDAKLADQTVLITVPASFDAAARDLTQRAAHLAGYPEVTIIEEPQSAFYAWIARNPNWRHQVKPGDLILVVDIGGGTTDFTLIAVTEQSGELQLERIAVGDHLLLGGDNMDLAVARFAEQQFGKLDTKQFYSLWQQCRAAKEILLSDSPDTPDQQPITILGRGSGLIAGTLRGSLSRHDVRNLLLEGFFPIVPADAMPQRQRRAALAEAGLNYATDPAVTKHLAQFLKHAKPTHLLLNGGVLQASSIEHRLVEVLRQWLGDAPLTELRNETKQADLMHAVAHGAAYYGLARTGKGVRIRGGVPRTYYVGIETSLPAIPGMPAPMKALTVVPFGLEEGSRIQLSGRKFALVVGEPAEFRFFSSLTRKDDEPGTLIDELDDTFEELDPIEVFLPASTESAREQVVPVTLETYVTETGMLELWCVASGAQRAQAVPPNESGTSQKPAASAGPSCAGSMDRRWKIEFNVRERYGS